MSKLSCRGLAVLALGLATGLVLASPASGQYFGRNKVQYRTFKYEVFKTAHFDVYFYGDGRQAAEDAGRKAERWLSRLSKVFQHRLSGTQPLILYMSHPDFEQTNVTPEEVDEGTGGFTDVFRRRIVLPLGASPADTDHVIGHELVHAFQFDITTQASRAGKHPRRDSSPAVVHRGHGRVPDDRPGRSAHGDVDPRRGRRQEAADAQGPRRPGVLPLPVGPGLLVLRDGPMGRQGGR